jgi:hypothetical protein
MTLRDSMIKDRSPSSAGGEVTIEELEKLFREASAAAQLRRRGRERYR